MAYERIYEPAEIRNASRGDVPHGVGKFYSINRIRLQNSTPEVLATASVPVPGGGYGLIQAFFGIIPTE